MITGFLRIVSVLAGLAGVLQFVYGIKSSLWEQAEYGLVVVAASACFLVVANIADQLSKR